MDNLPEELLLHIFSYVDPSERLLACGSVCQRWRSLVKDSSNWQSVNIPEWMSTKVVHSFLQLDFVKENVRHLTLTKYNTIPDVTLPKLTDLTVHELKQKDAVRIQKLKLKQLTIKEGSIKPMNRVSIRKIISSLKVSCPDLKATVLCLEVTKPSSLKAFKDVKQSCDVQKAWGTFPQKLPSQRSLSHFQVLSICTLPSACVLPTALKDLYISYPKLSLSDAVDRIPSMCPNLENYGFPEVLKGETESGQLIVNPLPKLKMLGFPRKNLSSKQVFAIIETWSALEALDLFYPIPSIALLTKVAEVNPLLKALSLIIVKKKQNLGPQVVTFPTLEKLRLDDTTLYVLSALRCPKLSTLDLPSAGMYSKSVSFTPADVCRYLTKIDVPVLDHNTAALLAPFEDTLQELAVMNPVFLCYIGGDNVSSYLRAVAKACPGISKIHLRFRIRYRPSFDESDEDSDNYWDEDSEEEEEEEEEREKYRFKGQLAELAEELATGLRCFKNLRDFAVGEPVKDLPVPLGRGDINHCRNPNFEIQIHLDRLMKPSNVSERYVDSYSYLDFDDEFDDENDGPGHSEWEDARSFFTPPSLRAACGALAS